jgi:PAS domain S-box-containing protein
MKNFAKPKLNSPRPEIAIPSLYEFAPFAYIALDKDGRILESNLMAAKMFGIERRDLLHAKITRFITSESQDAWYLHREAAFSNETKQVCEIEIRRTDSTLLLVRAESIGFGHGNRRYSRTVLLDITERKRMEKEREQLPAQEQAARRAVEAATRTGFWRRSRMNCERHLLRYWAGLGCYAKNS